MLWFQSQPHIKHKPEEEFKEAANEVKRASILVDADGIRQLKYKLVSSAFFYYGLKFGWLQIPLKRHYKGLRCLMRDLKKNILYYTYYFSSHT